jgi:hypothetical protein
VILARDRDVAPLRDTDGAERPGDAWAPVLTLRAGVVVTPAPAAVETPA